MTTKMMVMIERQVKAERVMMIGEALSLLSSREDPGNDTVRMADTNWITVR